MSWELKIHDDEFSDKVVRLSSSSLVYVSVGTGTRVYHAVSDTPVSSTLALSADNGTIHVSQPGEAFSDDYPNAMLTGRNVKRLSPRHFEITATYEDPTGGMAAEDLLALPAQVSSTGLNGTEEYAIDCDSPPKKVQNAAFEPFNRPPTRIAAGRIYTIVKYVDDDTKAIIQSAEHTNNNANVTIDGFVCPENTLLLSNAAFEVVQDFHRATMQIMYNPNGWQDDGLNAGYSELDPTTHKSSPIYEDDTATPPVLAAKPWPLNSDGTKKANRDDGFDTLTFYPYPLADWSDVPVA